MSKLFAFGDSFTRWRWPTWADVMAQDQNLELVNLGLMGIGNEAIYHRMVQLHTKYSVTKDDWVVVLWSKWNREDRIINGRWFSQGNNQLFRQGVMERLKRGVLKNMNEVKDEPAMAFAKMWNEDWDVIKNSSAIISANKMFDIRLNGSLEELDVLYPQQEFYKDSMPNLTYVRCTNTTNGYGLQQDQHPGIKEHAEICKLLLQSIGIEDLKPTTYDWVQKQDQVLIDNPPPDGVQGQDFQAKEMYNYQPWLDIDNL